MSAIPDFAGVLQGLVSQEAALEPETRAPMIFSSLKRHRAQQARREANFIRRSDDVDLARLDATFSTGIGRRVEEEAARLTNVGKEERITMLVNPKSIRFSQPKRYARVDGVGGTVWHHFTDDEGRNNDVLTITFQGNTGNIDRRGSLSAPDRAPFTSASSAANNDQLIRESDTNALARLRVWHDLYALTREEMVFTSGGRIVKNQFYVDYVSALFPIQIRFTGFFTKVLDWEESGAKPFSRDYGMEFIVEKTSPPLDVFLKNLSLRIETALANPAAFLPGGGNVSLSQGVPTSF